MSPIVLAIFLADALTTMRKVFWNTRYTEISNCGLEKLPIPFLICTVYTQTWKYQQIVYYKDIHLEM